MAENLSRTSRLQNPYRTFSNFVYPRTMYDVFVWGSWFWNRNHKYRTSISKVVNYFISSLNVTQDGSEDGEVDKDAVQNFEVLLEDTYDFLPLVSRFGEELASMGNVFVSAEPVFSRMLLCPDCDWMMALNKLKKNVDYTWDNCQFHGTCPQCGRRVTFKIHDTPSVSASGARVRFIFRSPEDMILKYNQLTGEYRYLYQIPKEARRGILSGDPVYLETTARVFLDAARNNDYVEFNSDRFFAMRTTTLSYLDKLYKGWGVPIFLASFPNVLRLAMLDRFNEAVAMEYINPVRLLSVPPEVLKAGNDPNRMPISGAALSGFLKEGLKTCKDNPTSWIISPVPISYQMLGGEAKQMAPVDLMEWYTSQILSDMGIPMEFRQTTFQTVAPTMGLRMFEKLWIHFAKDMNKFCQWGGSQIAQAHQVEKMSVRLDMTSFVEDDMNKNLKISLAQNGQIAMQNILEPLNIDYKKDVKQQLEEQQTKAELVQKMEMSQQNAEMTGSVMPPAAAPGMAAAQGAIDAAQQQAAGEAGMPAGAGMPMAPGAPMAPGMPPMPFNQGSSESATMEQLFAQATEMAQQLYSAPDRRQQLSKLKAVNPTLHAQVTQIIKDMEQSTASQAVAQSKVPQ